MIEKCVIEVDTETRSLLKKIAAMNGSTMQEFVKDAAIVEWNRIVNKGVKPYKIGEV